MICTLCPRLCGVDREKAVGYADAAKAIYRCAIAVGLVFVPYVFAFVAD